MNKYPQGYGPKIEYWNEQYRMATTEEGRKRAAEKLSYFIQRQKEVYGGIQDGSRL